MKKVLSIGQAAYDITLVLDKYPVENTKVRTSNAVECGGGSALNASCVFAKWGMDTSFAGIVGNDFYGSQIKKELLELGINIDYLKINNDINTTTSYIIANITDGTRTIIIKDKKEDGLVDEDISNIKVDGIMLDGREVEFSKKVLLANPDAISVLDAGNIKPSIIELGKYVKYFVCSHDFAQEYTNMSATVEDTVNLIRIHKKLVEDFQNTVVITLEASGSFTKVGDEYVIIPSVKVKPLDSTAAGDIYHGAFLYFLMNGYDLKTTMRFANITGAISTTRIGGRYSIPELNEVINFKEEEVIDVL